MANFLIVGLGNPGPEYELTRHNIGFLVLDKLASIKEVNFSSDRYGHKAEFKYAGKNFTLIKPNTFMNLSGKAVSYWLSQSKIPVENLLVVTDDLALPFGKIRMRPQGSHGGHNGLRNIQELLNSEKYTRLRIGVGNEFEKGKQVDYVLSNFDKKEMENLDELLNYCAEGVVSFARNGLAMTMNQYNK